jgi:hypothetical protein
MLTWAISAMSRSPTFGEDDRAFFPRLPAFDDDFRRRLPQVLATDDYARSREFSQPA